MSRPPDIPADELYRKLLERPAPAEEIDWPGKDKEFRIRIEVQRKKSIDDCHFKAQRWWDAGYGKAQEQQGLAAKEIMADRMASEILAVAVTRTKPIPGTEDSEKPQYPRVFPDADGVRKALFPDELEILWQAYQLVQYKYGPYEESVSTAEDRNAWVAKLAQGGNAYPLLCLPLPQLLQLTASLAAERCVLCGVLDSLLPQLQESWASALTNSPFGISCSIWPHVEPSDQGGLRIEWPEVASEPLPTRPKHYIDVRELATEIVQDARLASMTEDVEP